jgi:hypothetical protein
VMYNRGRRKLASGVSQRGEFSTRVRAYGGAGAMVDTPGGAEVRLANLEPHAQVIERRTRLAALMLERVRAAGLAATAGKVARALRTGRAA